MYGPGGGHSRVTATHMSERYPMTGVIATYAAPIPRNTKPAGGYSSFCAARWLCSNSVFCVRV